MFGYVSANPAELTPEQKERYGAVYCGVCRRLRQAASQTARLTLSYDMAFLALLLMSLYEPEETAGGNACALHPIHKRPWVDNVYVAYGADMNIALGYYQALDDWQDENKRSARAVAHTLEKHLPRLREAYPRQLEAIARCMEELSLLEKAGCANPDEPAGCFGKLLAELLVYREDNWSPVLRQMGMALGRFIYLADAAVDYRRDRKKGRYNPFLAMDTGEDWARWEQYLVLEMSRCTLFFEKLPLVQDKALLDNILYSGIWLELRRRQGKKKGGEADG